MVIDRMFPMSVVCRTDDLVPTTRRRMLQFSAKVVPRICYKISDLCRILSVAVPNQLVYM